MLTSTNSSSLVVADVYLRRGDGCRRNVGGGGGSSGAVGGAAACSVAANTTPTHTPKQCEAAISFHTGCPAGDVLDKLAQPLIELENGENTKNSGTAPTTPKTAN